MNYGNWGRTYREENGGDGSDLGAGGEDNTDGGDDATKTDLTLGGDDKKDDLKLGDENKDDADKDKTEGAPETYADFEVPEGVELDKDLIGKASELFKEANMSQETAQKFVDLYAGAQQEATDAMVKMHTDQVADWETNLRADKDIGGDNLNQSLANAKLALQTHGTPELTKYLDETGLGKHPEIIRLLNNFGATLQEDNPGAGKPSGGDGMTPEEERLARMYPEQQRN